MPEPSAEVVHRAVQVPACYMDMELAGRDTISVKTQTDIRQPAFDLAIVEMPGASE